MAVESMAVVVSLVAVIGKLQLSNNQSRRYSL